MRLLAALTAAAPLALVVPGCATSEMTPQQVYAEASDTYTDVVTTLTALREAGKIDDETWAIVLPLIEEGDQLLDQWGAQIEAGDVDGARLARSAIRGIVTRLTVYLLTHDAEESG